MIQLGQNERLSTNVIVVITIIVLVIFKVSDLKTAFRYVGIVTTLIYLATSVFNVFLWRIQLLQWFQKIPDFSGRWEGWYYSFAKMSSGWQPTAHEIRQNAFNIMANAWGLNNWARGINKATIVVDHQGDVPELSWIYKTEQTTVTFMPGDSHTGTHLLRLIFKDGKKQIEGRYMNDRAHDDGTIGSGGIIKLVWVSRKHRNTLDYNEEKWGMPKPIDSP